MERFSVQTQVFTILSLISVTPMFILWRFGFLAPSGLWLLLILLPVLYVVARLMTGPLRELTVVARRLNEGALQSKASAPLKGPWGEVAKTMETLAEQLDTTTQRFDEEVLERTRELDRKANQLRALGQVGQQVAAVLEPSELLHFVVRVVRGTFSYDLVAVVQDEGDHLVLSACAARGVSDVPLGRVFSVHAPEVDALRQGLSGGGAISNRASPLVDSIEAQAQLTVAIRLGERTIGALVVQSLAPTAFDEDDIFTVRTIAGQVAVALENARLFEAERQLRSMAITEERNRIAREIHDTLAQGLMGILMHLRAMRGAKDAETAKMHRAQAELVAQEGLEEARRSVWNLRPERLERRGLSGALEDEVERIRKRAGLHIELEYAGDVDDLPPRVAAGLLRIVQEGLHNVLKHARTRVARVRLTVHEDIKLSIADDGIGFDPDTLPLPSEPDSGFGLNGMRERAHLIGGEFELRTAPGEGTTVTVHIPRREVNDNVRYD